MSASEFIKIQSSASTGILGALPRDIVIASRETVTGFDPDEETGLITITSSDIEAFEAANAGSLGLINALRTVFAGSVAPEQVYILPTGGGALTEAMLNKANTYPRLWSIITPVSQTLGVDDAATYIADAGVIADWLATAKNKIGIVTLGAETGSVQSHLNGLPSGYANKIANNMKCKTLVTDSRHDDDEYTPVYDNIGLAWLAFCLYGGDVVRSMGSLSDAHDFPYISPDKFTQTERSFIATFGAGQYNGSKDYGNTPFIFDTNLNKATDPDTGRQIETQLAIDFFDDYLKVGVRNTYQQAGSIGLPSDQVGINSLAATVEKYTRQAYDLGVILTAADGKPDYTVKAKSAAQVTAIDPTWQSTGTWPADVVEVILKPYGATHYITIGVTYQ